MKRQAHESDEHWNARKSAAITEILEDVRHNLELTFESGEHFTTLSRSGYHSPAIVDGIHEGRSPNSNRITMIAFGDEAARITLARTFHKLGPILDTTGLPPVTYSGYNAANEEAKRILKEQRELKALGDDIMGKYQAAVMAANLHELDMKWAAALGSIPSPKKSPDPNSPEFKRTMEAMKEKPVPPPPAGRVMREGVTIPLADRIVRWLMILTLAVALCLPLNIYLFERKMSRHNDEFNALMDKNEKERIELLKTLRHEH